jgi:hypothetical protein
LSTIKERAFSRHLSGCLMLIDSFRRVLVGSYLKRLIIETIHALQRMFTRHENHIRKACQNFARAASRRFSSSWPRRKQIA